MPTWISRAMPALFLILTACGGSDSDRSPEPAPVQPTVQSTVTPSIDGGLANAELRYLVLTFGDAVNSRITNSGEIDFIGPFGPLGGSMGSSGNQELWLESWWQPLYPNAEYRFTLPVLKLENGRLVKVPSTVSVRAPIQEVIAPGTSHVCALRVDGRVRCWGVGSQGQLGTGSPDTIGDSVGEMGDALSGVDLGTAADGTTPLRAVQLASGQNHSCALLETGAVKCWGANNSGQLGRGDDSENVGAQAGEMGNTLPRVDLGSGRTALYLAAGGDRSCALLDNAQLKCWGDNSSGALGAGLSKSAVGRSAGDMGDALPAVSLGTSLHAVHVSVGHTHTCAVLIDANVKCWGSNDSGELGQGDTKARGSDPGDMGDALKPVALGVAAHAQRVEAGVNGTCVLLDGMPRVKCWGLNDRGQLGLGHTDNRGNASDQMGDALPPVQLRPLNVVRALVVSDKGACAMEFDHPNRLFCWGAGDKGQLGLDNTEDRGSAPDQMGANAKSVMLPTGSRVARVSASMFGGFACARLENGQLYCWGNNTSFVISPAGEQVGDELGEMAALQPINLGTLVLGPMQP
ncbi:MAG: hypothetical protein H7Y33_00450 [Cytophagales bacterium]|nr:hypothetical protein [Rhizobacter sp.]